ncbi:putative aquaglyceroporin [Aspergillus homomorphus CBS 101889]|uniref:MIP transporter n=1 Tax=Aspergillus homomorphus (strain CBS 101889) TaxID=1450537 RepID=A0A395HL10_ASPHC|nr:MIP transporter [Aspergillus homomorphus CBS 101889]RAL08286.1 MIP transporter [Aspergillus homomorphus CBS 101889]
MANALESHKKEVDEVQTDPEEFQSQSSETDDESSTDHEKSQESQPKERPPNNRPPASRQATARTQRTGEPRDDVSRSKTQGSQPPGGFSLAGSNAFWGAPPSYGPYIHPEYHSYNPHYGNSEPGKPVWSLAQPLPHVVRDGMRYGALPEDRKEEEQEDGRSRPPPAAEEPPTGIPQTEEAKENGEELEPDGFFNIWSKVRFYAKEPFAEWLGTSVAITLGLCAGLSHYTSQGQAGTYASQCAAWGFSFMIGIYIAGGVSGAHLNPAITISLSVWRGFPARKCTLYVLAQVLGAITAGGLAYAIYHDAIVDLSVKSQVIQSKTTASQALLTGPKDFVTPVTAFFDEFLGSAILVGIILALGDDANAPPGAGMQAFIIGIVITVLLLALGYNTGGCFNAPRDFGPRLTVLMAGWGGQVFMEKNVWWVWGPWIADIFGGLFGAMVYDLAIFTGGESPVNYPPRRRKRALLIKEKNLRDKLHIGRHKIKDLEKAVEENQD